MTTIADVITAVSRKYGVDPNLSLATAYLESGLNPHAVGDNGTSFGLFQLHRGGELGNHTESWADDPWNNANTAISEIARYERQHPNVTDPGLIAARAQRPADPSGYAATVDRYYYTKAWTQSKYAGAPTADNPGAVTNTMAQGQNEQTPPKNSFDPFGVFHSIGDALSAPVQGLQDIAKLSNVIIALLMPGNLMRVAMAALGLILMGLGIYFIAKDV